MKNNMILTFFYQIYYIFELPQKGYQTQPQNSEEDAGVLQSYSTSFYSVDDSSVKGIRAFIPSVTNETVALISFSNPRQKTSVRQFKRLLIPRFQLRQIFYNGLSNRFALDLLALLLLKSFHFHLEGSPRKEHLRHPVAVFSHHVLLRPTSSPHLAPNTILIIIYLQNKHRRIQKQLDFRQATTKSTRKRLPHGRGDSDRVSTLYLRNLEQRIAVYTSMNAGIYQSLEDDIESTGIIMAMNHSLGANIFWLRLMQYCSFVNFLVSDTDLRRPMHPSQFPIRAYPPRPTPKCRYRITHRSNHGQIRMSASEMASPRKQSPAIALSIPSRVSLISCWKSQMEAICLSLALLKSSMTALHSLPTSSRIRARWKVSLGMRLLPEGKLSAKYQHTGSLSVRQRSPWMRMGTFPSDFGSLPSAFRYMLPKYSPFSPRLTFVKVVGSYFQRAVMRARCANGQNLLQIIVTALGFSIGVGMIKYFCDI